MSLALRQFAALVAKDLALELRSRQILALVAVLAMLIVAVLGLGLGPQQLASGYAAPAVLWVAYLFAGILCFERTMAPERHDGALAALLLAPVDRSVIYLAKLTTNLLLMLAVALVVTPVAAVLFGFDLAQAPLAFTLTIVVSMVGFAAVGTLFSAVTSSSSMRSAPLAMLILPVTLPLVLASTHLLVALFRDGQPITQAALAILVAFGLIYLTVSWLVFEFILEP